MNATVPENVRQVKTLVASLLSNRGVNVIPVRMSDYSVMEVSQAISVMHCSSTSVVTDNSCSL
eukprot:5255038-Amphidinium_carterae.1